MFQLLLNQINFKYLFIYILLDIIKLNNNYNIISWFVIQIFNLLKTKNWKINLEDLLFFYLVDISRRFKSI